MTTTTTEPVDLWRNHAARYLTVRDAVDRGFDRSGLDLTALEKHSMETFVTILTDYVSELVTKESTVEEWIEQTNEYLVTGWPVLSLLLAAGTMEAIVFPRQESHTYGLAGQALRNVIDQLSPIAENEEPEVFEKYNEW